MTTLNLYWYTLRTEETGGFIQDIAQFSTPLLVWTTVLKDVKSTLHYIQIKSAFSLAKNVKVDLEYFVTLFCMYVAIKNK